MKNKIKSAQSEEHQYHFYLSDHDLGAVEVEELCESLLEWAHSDKAWVLRQFLNENGIPESTFNNWTSKSQKLSDAYSIARSLIGCRREKAALFRQIDSRTFLEMAPQYDDEYKKTIEWRSRLRGKEASQTGQAIYNCIQEAFPSDDRVPVRGTVEHSSDPHRLYENKAATRCKTL